MLLTYAKLRPNRLLCLHATRGFASGNGNGIDDQKMKESIENAKRSGAVGRVGKNPEAFDKNRQSFYNAMDYNKDYRERIQRQNFT